MQACELQGLRGYRPCDQCQASEVHLGLGRVHRSSHGFSRGLHNANIGAAIPWLIYLHRPLWNRSLGEDCSDLATTLHSEHRFDVIGVVNQSNVLCLAVVLSWLPLTALQSLVFGCSFLVSGSAQSARATAGNGFYESPDKHPCAVKQ